MLRFSTHTYSMYGYCCQAPLVPCPARFMGRIVSHDHQLI
jgi:hypothetical protein